MTRERTSHYTSPFIFRALHCRYLLMLSAPPQYHCLKSIVDAYCCLRHTLPLHLQRRPIRKGSGKLSFQPMHMMKHLPHNPVSTSWLHNSLLKHCTEYMPDDAVNYRQQGRHLYVNHHEVYLQYLLLLYIFRGSPRLWYGKPRDCYMKKRKAGDIQSVSHKAPIAMRRYSPVSLPGFVICGAEHLLLSPLGRVTSRALLVGVFCEFCILLYPILFHFSIHSTHLVSRHFFSA